MCAGHQETDIRDVCARTTHRPITGLARVRLHAGGYEVVQAESTLCDPVAKQALDELMVL